jgi:hypothetical protein
MRMMGGTGQDILHDSSRFFSSALILFLDYVDDRALHQGRATATPPHICTNLGCSDLELLFINSVACAELKINVTSNNSYVLGVFRQVYCRK